jgi:hypothetical protein
MAIGISGRYLPRGLALALAVALGGCGKGQTTTKVFEAPGGEYRITVERTDYGAYRDTLVTGRISGFLGDPDSKPVELFEIRGSNQLSLTWRGPLELVARTCGARRVSHRSGLWHSVERELFVSVVNEKPRQTKDGLICDLEGQHRL